MPRLPFDYSKCVMYKICCLNPEIKDEYIGHTTNFIKRKAQHKNDCNNNTKISHLKVYQFIRANGGWENWSMIELEKFSCNDFNEACSRERYWLETLKATLNSNVPNRSIKEWYEDNKEKNLLIKKEYRDNHKEIMEEYGKTYYKENKNIINEKAKIYYEINKSDISAKNKEYRKNNKEKEKIRHQKYCEENRDIINEKARLKYKNNNDKNIENYKKNKDNINARRKKLRLEKKLAEQEI